MIKVALLTTMLTGGAAGVLQAQATPSPALLVLAKRDTSLAIVDPATLKVVGRVPAGPDPHEVVASPDGKLAYVSNYGFGTYNTISVIDLEAARRLTAIDLGPLHGPHGLWFAGGELYFTAEANKVIGRYDPGTHKVDWVLGTGQNRTHISGLRGPESHFHLECEFRHHQRDREDDGSGRWVRTSTRRTSTRRAATLRAGRTAAVRASGRSGRLDASAAAGLERDGDPGRPGLRRF